VSNDNKEYIKGRGAQINPANRFFKNSSGDVYDDINEEDEEVTENTKFIEVFPKTIVNKVGSPDVPMYYSLNPYQGCEHGCIYCYARPTHEYWGYSAGIDFERIILVKKNAPELLRQTLSKKNWEVHTIGLSGNTDCYQPIEKKYGITRKLLEVCLEFKQPVSIITKNALICRDIDVLKELADLGLIAVNISVTTLKEELRRVLEPRTASVKLKLKTIEMLSQAGIPVNVMLAPIIPALNDDEIFSIAKMTAESGARTMHYQVVRLNGPNEETFTDWVTQNFPNRADKVLNQLREIHGGAVSSTRFRERMTGGGVLGINIQHQVELAKKRHGLNGSFPKLRTDLFQVPGSQLRLF
jgi:DNA repair photolyase